MDKIVVIIVRGGVAEIHHRPADVDVDVKIIDFDNDTACELCHVWPAEGINSMHQAVCEACFKEDIENAK